MLLVGCGKMGSSLLKGWIEKLADLYEFYVLEPNVEHHFSSKASFYEGVDSLPKYKYDIIFFAIKPQLAKNIVPLFSPFLDTKTICITIMAGICLHDMKGYLSHTKILRAMPNIPASVQKGITAIFSDQTTDSVSRSQCDNLFLSVGQTVWLKKEDDLHIATAISGSGPAYFYLLVELLIEAAISQGLDRETACRLVQGTFIGSASLQEALNVNAAELRNNVTSPGGTTQAALDVFFENDNFSSLVKKAVEAAKKRSIALA